jgi:hypothetical protein
MNALGAKACVGKSYLFLGRLWHSGRIAQVKDPALAEVYLTTERIKRSFIIGFTIVNTIFVVGGCSAKRASPTETN